ncbi:MAG: hypothetical protein P8X57_09330 [Cyclobacteriaceae bacterium]
MEELPIHISLLFGFTVLGSIIWFFTASGSKSSLLIISGWTLLQSVLGLSGVYQDTKALPPKLMLFGIFPALLFIGICFRMV